MSEPDDERPIRVGIGLISRGGRYLVRQRPAGQIMAGYWEFPGGKCEPESRGMRPPPASAWKRSACRSCSAP